MSDLQFTTGQVSGMTGIKPGTLRKYVSTYRDLFTERAAQRTHGRRFTTDDIQRLLLIRRLHAAHKGEPAIRLALAGELTEIPSLDVPALVEYAVKSIQASQREVKRARDDMGTCLERFRKIIADARKVPEIEKQLIELQDDLRKVQAHLSIRQVKGPTWRERLMDAVNSLTEGGE